jgi:ferredoxin-NADP reductase
MLSSYVRSLTFDPGADFRFVAGQWVNLRMPTAPGQEEVVRAYSIASGPRSDGTYELAVTKVEGGPMSNWLHALEPGATVVQSHAQGFFTLDEPSRPVLFVATGTGVSPFRAMLEAMKDDRPDDPVTLLFGNRTEEDILYCAEFEALAREWPGFTFVPTLSRPSPAWTGKTGYVQTHLRELLAPHGTNVDAYVCGLNKMVADVKQLLRKEIGLDRQRVHGERYD